MQQFLPGLRFSLFKALPMEAKLCVFGIYNDILATGVVPQSWHRQESFIIGLV
jgi:hypothetical protein